MKDEPVISKDKKGDELLKESMEYLDEVTFKFACFADHYKQAVDKLIRENKK